MNHVTIVLFLSAISSLTEPITGQSEMLGQDRALCQLMIGKNADIVKHITAAKKNNFTVELETYRPVDQCKFRCTMVFKKQSENNIRKHFGSGTVVDYSQCTTGAMLTTRCLKGECVDVDFCRDMLKKEIDEALKNGKFPTVEMGISTKPCEVPCHLKINGKTTKNIQAPDYFNCGQEPDGTQNYCMSGKCVNAGTNDPKNKGPTRM